MARQPRRLEIAGLEALPLAVATAEVLVLLARYSISSSSSCSVWRCLMISNYVQKCCK